MRDFEEINMLILKFRWFSNVLINARVFYIRILVESFLHVILQTY